MLGISVRGYDYRQSSDGGAFHCLILEKMPKADRRVVKTHLKIL